MTKPGDKVLDYNFSDRCKNLEGNAIREIFKLISQPDIISFAGGMPASQALPKDEMRVILNSLLASDIATSLLQYGATEGYVPFLKEGAKYVEKVGIKIKDLSEILAISGGQQGIDLTFKAFINKGDRILVEAPTYVAVPHIAKTYEAELIGVQSDDDGINLEDLEKMILEHNPKLLYIVPTFSNPTGRTIDVEKRKKIAEITAKHNVIVLEDNPYGELRYSGECLPSIKSFDNKGNVIYLTSFSKTISPGMRVGLAVASEKVIRKLTIGKQATDVHTTTLFQAATTEFLKQGLLKEILDKNIPLYKVKLDTMLKALAMYFPSSAKWTHPEGGLFIWVTFPKTIDVAGEIFREAINRKVAYVAGNSSFVDGSGRNCLRLNFSNATETDIMKGIKILGDLLKEKLEGVC
ncbi:MAG: PLP-dependent aminotransferase family protein [Christensenellaceae bacterium]|jgi:2-aminoadipate transaminase|nr:PLP-dependent aminotransferase family protein [Christensenellaceae bacterium]